MKLSAATHDASCPMAHAWPQASVSCAPCRPTGSAAADWHSNTAFTAMTLELHARPAGKYELCAVLTHKGRSADSGHYVSWVKQDDGSWIQFDDDQLIPRKVMLWDAIMHHREVACEGGACATASPQTAVPQLSAKVLATAQPLHVHLCRCRCASHDTHSLSLQGSAVGMTVQHNNSPTLMGQCSLMCITFMCRRRRFPAFQAAGTGTWPTCCCTEPSMHDCPTWHACAVCVFVTSPPM